MGWDLFVCRFSRGYDAMAAVPDHEHCLPLEVSDTLRAAITQAFPGTDWSDARWGIYNAGSGRVEFNIGDDEPVEGIVVHVHSDKSVLHTLVHFCQIRGWQILDIASGVFIDRDPGKEGILSQRWLDYGLQIPDRGNA